MKHIGVIFLLVLFSWGFASGVGWVPPLPGVQHVGSSSLFLPLFQKCEAIPLTGVFESSERQRCFYTTLHAMVQRYGIATTISAFRAYLVSPQGAYLQGMRCHAMAHEIGNAAAASGVPSDILLTQCIGLCSAGAGSQPIDGIDLGCMNGAAHTWVLLSPQVASVFDKCAVPRVSQEVREGCFHGIGHGLSEKYGGNLMKEIEECITLPNARARYQCSHAVFMEKQALAGVGVSSLPVDPIGYCRSLPGEVQESCFEFSGSLQYFKTRDVPRSLAVCRHILSTDLEFSCWDRIGEALYLSHQQGSDINMCFTGHADEGRGCMTGFVRTSIDNVNDLYGKSALVICSGMPHVYQTECYAMVGRIVKERYGQRVQTSICDTIEKIEYKKACISAE